jgi:hypothetical protein
MAEKVWTNSGDSHFVAVVDGDGVQAGVLAAEHGCQSYSCHPLAWDVALRSGRTCARTATARTEVCTSRCVKRDAGCRNER